MEQIKSIPRSLPEGIAPTFAALLSHLQANSSLIHSQYSSLEIRSASLGNDRGDAKYPSGGEECALAIQWIA